MSDKPTRACFIFKGFSYDEATGKLALNYAHDAAESFTETITFHDAPKIVSDAQRDCLNRAFRQLHLAAGVSYYKACLPEKIIYEAGAPLIQDEAAFFESFYVNGLGEFAYLNGLDLRGKICFPFIPSGKREEEPPPYQLPRKTLVPIGGGKDSIVALESLRAKGEPIILFAVGSAPPIAETIAASGLPAVRISRQIAPALLELNKQGAWNGHIPITGILSFITPIVGILYGADAVAFANERSASSENLIHDGQAINHQWSKSLDFELACATHIKKTIHPDFHYYSVLRPYTEIAIARQFAKHETYFPVFNSCNKNFSHTRAEHGWCGACPKCQFVFLMLAPFIEKEKLIGIFGRNLLANNHALDDYKALLGLTGNKPFECVGEIDESRMALRLIANQPEWQNDTLVAGLIKQVDAPLNITSPEAQRFFCAENSPNIPDRLRNLFDAP
jgi:hypothetical protein